MSYCFSLFFHQTRSGKIMRRILRKVAAGEEDSIGDTTTLADPTVVQRLVERFKEAYKTKQKSGSQNPAVSAFIIVLICALVVSWC